jgi:formate dehydrogenase major subunit
MHSRLWQEPLVGPRVQFSVVEFEPPVDMLDECYPIRLTTGRRLDSFNTGVQTAGYRSPLRRQEALGLSPEDGAKYAVADGERVRISSRRGAVEACVRYDPSLRPGLAFLSLHNPEEVSTNFLTIDAVDPESGTAEFKATAIRVDKLPPLALGPS